MQYQQLNQAFQSDPRRILGQTLMGQGASSAPVRTPLQGLGRLSSALVGAYLQRKAGDAQVARETEMTNQIMGMLPANATAQQRAFAAANPAAFAQIAGQAQFMPTNAAFVRPADGGGTLYGTRSTSPFGPSSETVSGFSAAPKPIKPDVITFVNEQNNAQSLRTNDPDFNVKADRLLAAGYTERQGGGTNVSVNPTIALGQEQKSEFRKATAKAASQTISDLQAQVRSEADLTTRLNIADNLLEGGTETGSIINLTMPIRNIGKELGFLNDEQAKQLNNQQILTAAFNYIIPRMRVVGSGATSDFEARLFSSATANMANTPEANKVLVKSMQALVERRSNILKAMEKYADENDDLIGFAEYADQTVPPALKAYMTDGEYDAAVQNGELKIGDLYFNGFTSTFEIYEEDS
tara:strand:- start:1694 stop:2923 length:1230 start_codon:yes stop_codon:yes gene_type:complete